MVKMGMGDEDQAQVITIQPVDGPSGRSDPGAPLSTRTKPSGLAIKYAMANLARIGYILMSDRALSLMMYRQTCGC
jgi:hypothetical protein